MRDSPYVGPPSEELDETWRDLMSHMAIRVTQAELNQNNQTSVALPHGGYLAWLGVYHQLHCVVRAMKHYGKSSWDQSDRRMQKMLRQLNYRDHYHPNLTTQDQADWQVHADHCFELLRASVMCQADTSSLTTFIWDKSEKPMLNSERPLHQCVDWDELVASTKHRAVGRDETANMKNPLLL